MGLGGHGSTGTGLAFEMAPYSLCSALLLARANIPFVSQDPSLYLYCLPDPITFYLSTHPRLGVFNWLIVHDELAGVGWSHGHHLNYFLDVHLFHIADTLIQALTTPILYRCL